MTVGFLLLAFSSSLNAADAIQTLLRPVVEQEADGRLHLFFINQDGELTHRWQKQPSGTWTRNSSLGGSFFSGVAVATRADKRLAVFGVDRISNELKHAYQLEPNGYEWSEWMGLEGKICAPVSAARNRDGRLEVFAVSLVTRSVLHAQQINREGAWFSEWEDLGGKLEPELVVLKNREGYLELFGIDETSKGVRYCRQLSPNGAGGWTEWIDLGGSFFSGLAAGHNMDGRLEIFAVDRGSNRVLQNKQIITNNRVEWSGWIDFGANAFPGLTMAQNADGRLEVFGVNASKTNLMHAWQLAPNGSRRWSTWDTMRSQSQPYAAVGKNVDGNLEVFTVDPEEPTKLNHRRQISANRDWLDWFSMDYVEFPYTSRTWQTDEGLPHGVVQSLAQTPEGYLWVGTQNGLARFDGIRFTVFDGKNTPEMKNAFISCLSVDREGTLWVGTQDGLLTWNQGKFHAYGTNDGLAGNWLNVIHEARDGTVWIGTTNGLSSYKNGRFSSYRQQDGLLSDIIRALYEDRNKQLWIGTAAGLNRLKEDIFSGFSRTNGLPENSIRGISQDKGGRLWIGSDNGMIWYNTGESNRNQFHAYDRQYGLSDSFVSTVREDRAGNLWVGTYSGLNRFREGRFFPELNSEGGAYDKVNAILEDREGNMWIGSKDGLIRLTPKLFFPFTKRQGLTHNNTVSVLEDRNGVLWTGTWGGGLNRVKDERVTAYLQTNGLANDLVLALCEGKDGSLWIGADFGGGLTRFKDGKFTRYTSKDGLPDGAVRVLHEDRSGGLWIGRSTGLSRLNLKDGAFTSFTIKDGLGGNTVRSICEGRDGEVWIGTDGGLSRWEDGGFHNLTVEQGLSDNKVFALYEDEARNLWVGTGSGGLNRHRNGHVRAYTTQQGLFSDEIFEILEDDHGWLWMSCSKGIFRVRKSDLDELDEGKRKAVGSMVYGKVDGMETTLCNGVAKPAGWKGRDGRLWFTTTKGLVSVMPEASVNLMPPTVLLEQLIADKIPLLDRPMNSVSGGAAEEGVIIPAGRNELEFHFTAINFHDPQEIRFRYMLEGLETDWRDAGTHRVAHYNNLYPGDYRFRVMACSADGIWSEGGVSLAVTLRPHFWQSWWFRLFTFAGAVVSVGGVSRFITRRRLQRKMELLEQQHAIEKERGRIAKDIHDDLGSSLTRIMMLGERAQEEITDNQEIANHVGKIVASARSTVQSMDEIVWAINPENDTLDGLVGYISQYANQFFEGTPTRCRLDVPVDLPATILAAEVRHHFFLVIKEALNNVLKHSKASEVRVEVQVDAEKIKVLIEDNGCGFDESKLGAGRKGNGLQNMRKRMSALGGDLELASVCGKGTRLTCSVNFRRKGVG